MTATITPETFFSNHLGNDFWNSMTAEKQNAAIEMATSDIIALLPVRFDITQSEFAQKAIFEQALYLLKNYETISSGKVVSSQSVGELSQGFTLINSNFGISPRAYDYIYKAKNAACSGLGRLARG